MRPALEKITPDPGSSFYTGHTRCSGFRFLWHQHPEAELTLIVHGRGTRFVGDSIEPFRPGDLVLLAPELPHTWQSTASVRRGLSEAIYVQFRVDMLGGPLAAIPEARAIADLLARARRGLRFVGATRERAAQKLMALPSATGLPRLLALLDVLQLLAVGRDARPLCGASYEAPTSSGQRRIDRVCRYLAEHFLEPLSLPRVAAQAHLNPSSFARFFNRSTGHTMTEYLNELRVGHACHLLLDTDMSIAAIAHASGFRNLSHFNRRFLRSRKMSPRDYREHFLRKGSAR